jgi:3-deoxy-D-manno-octulosonic-acid transferase
MVVIYFLVIKIYGFSIWMASFFNKKAATWIEGRKNLFEHISQTLHNENAQRLWFHCASLGEFEQGKPVIEAVKIAYPQFKIVLTFFSPSGYALKKNDPIADYVFYLPLDGPQNAQKFIDIVKPHAAFFVKYEFWHFYIKRLRDKKINCYYFSCNFRPTQTFFQFYGRFYKNMLQRITHIFVQNQTSLALLYKHSIPHVTVSGDTRFDRVFANSQQKKSVPIIAQFADNQKLFVAGSTWPADIKMLAHIQHLPVKFIIAPHEITDEHIHQIESLFTDKVVRFSKWNNDVDVKVLIIDNMGMLSSLYAYAHITYIGGGFGAGIHNILEAAVYGCPIIIGPNYQKFNEAKALVHNNGAFVIQKADDLHAITNTLLSDSDMHQSIMHKNQQYVLQNKGATEIIMHYLQMNW